MENKLKSKKILYIITQTQWGGAQKYILDLAQYFGQANEVHIAYGEIKNPDPYFLSECQKLNIKTIAIPYLIRNIDLGKDYLAIIEIAKLLNKENYDLIHLNSSKMGLLGSLAAKYYALNLLNTKVRIVYTAHGFVFNEPLSKLRKKIYKISETISTSIQNAVIAVSEADRQSAIKHKITSERKIFTIHNGLDFDKYNFYEKEKALTELGLDKNKKYFGTIAGFYETKGYTYLIDAIKELKNNQWPEFTKYFWIFMGDGPIKEKISKQILEAGLEDKIKIIDSQNDAFKYLKAFEIFILPSVKEGLPYTILEAGLAQVPVITTHVGGIPEIITDQKNGILVAPANPLALAEAIKKLAEDNQLAKILAQSNYENIKNNFSLEKTIQKTEELYLKLF
ncbi:MAG: glycosyltransferase family 4 protein [bacterium]|nr:glycosyltransferase family 4 protein [bacterium]